MAKIITLLTSLFPILLLLFAHHAQFFRFAEGLQRKVHITDDLDDVEDDEEDDDWKEWGKQSSPSMDKFDPPPLDMSNMDLPEMQNEMMKRHFGPTFGFVKLRLGVDRTLDMVGDIAMKWTKVVKTGAIAAKFMTIDRNTIMITMQRGQDTMELKEFVLSQPEAYEIKIGDLAFRRPGDPPLEEVVEKIRSEKNRADASSSLTENDANPKEEL